MTFEERVRKYSYTDLLDICGMARDICEKEQKCYGCNREQLKPIQNACFECQFSMSAWDKGYRKEK